MSTKTNISTGSGPVKVAPFKFKSKNKGLKIQSSMQNRQEHISRGILGSDLVRSLRDIDTPVGRDVTCGNPYKKVK